MRYAVSATVHDGSCPQSQFSCVKCASNTNANSCIWVMSLTTAVCWLSEQVKMDASIGYASMPHATCHQGDTELQYLSEVGFEKTSKLVLSDRQVLMHKTYTTKRLCGPPYAAFCKILEAVLQHILSEYTVKVVACGCRFSLTYWLTRYNEISKFFLLYARSFT